MAKKSLQDLVQEKDNFDKQSQVIINSMVFQKKELDEISAMKRTEGWKILNTKIREELHNRIFELIKDDLKVMSLIDLLKVADHKSRIKVLNDEIEAALPDE